jgi:hypothetical protein
VPVTSWPSATRLGIRYWPIAPVAPATKTRMIASFLCCPLATPLYDAMALMGVTLF